MLVIENCRLTWPDFTADYSLTVETGHLCAVIGPSGGGKTTLLHMIAGFERPESGTLSFNGQNLLPLEPAKRPVAIVFQDHNLFPHLSAAQNVALGLRPSLRLTEDETLRCCGDARFRRAQGLRRPQARRDVGRPASARGAGTRAHLGPPADPARRAVQQPRSGLAPRHDPARGRDAAQARRHDSHDDPYAGGCGAMWPIRWPSWPTVGSWRRDIPGPF